MAHCSDEQIRELQGTVGFIDRLACSVALGEATSSAWTQEQARAHCAELIRRREEHLNGAL